MPGKAKQPDEPTQNLTLYGMPGAYVYAFREVVALTGDTKKPRSERANQIVMDFIEQKVTETLGPNGMEELRERYRNREARKRMAENHQPGPK